MSKSNKLTDTQLIVLSKAAARDDGFAAVPDSMNKAAAQKVGAGLIAKKLMREMRAKLDRPVWRRDAEGRDIALVITKAGRKAIGVGDVPARVAPDSGPPSAMRLGKDRAEPASNASSRAADATEPTAFRDGSKGSQLVAMLSSAEGATLNAIVDATGWLPHSARAALTGLRKRGFAVQRAREGSVSCYRIAVLEASTRSNNAPTITTTAETRASV